MNQLGHPCVSSEEQRGCGVLVAHQTGDDHEMESAPIRIILLLVFVTALAIFQAWRVAAAVSTPDAGIGTALVGMVGELGDAWGIDPNVTVTKLDAQCGQGAWSVWYELGTSGDLVPGSLVVECE